MQGPAVMQQGVRGDAAAGGVVVAHGEVCVPMMTIACTSSGSVHGAALTWREQR